MDDYKLNAYPVCFFDYFIDIGACTGGITLQMAERHPDAIIICYEPCKSNYDILVTNVENHPKIVAVNEAMGSGEDLFFKDMGRIDRHLFVKENTGAYVVKSKTLAQIFDIHEIDLNKKCFLKIDCEGGEVSLMGDSISEEVMKKCTHIAMEVHFRHEKNKNKWLNVFPGLNIYNSWFHNVFEETHNILYWKSDSRHGHGIYVIEKKDR